MNTYKTLSISLAFAFAAPGLAHADINDIRNADSALELDVGAMHQDYGETLHSKTFDTENGLLPTVALGAKALFSDKNPLILQNLYLQLDGSISGGNVNYNGGIQFGNGTTVPYSTASNSHIYTFNAKIGRAFPVGSMFMLTPFADFGTRYWDRHIPGFAGITEDYSNGEAMGGGMLQFSPFSSWVFTVSGELGTTLGPSMESSGTTYQLGNSMVYQANAKIGYTFAPHWEATGSVEYKTFNYGNSSEINGALEPNSTTHETTGLIGIAWHWK